MAKVVKWLTPLAIVVAAVLMFDRMYAVTKPADRTDLIVGSVAVAVVLLAVFVAVRRVRSRVRRRAAQRLASQSDGATSIAYPAGVRRIEAVEDSV
jgi:nitrogen fixation/metabolism regulation signal transduction histidine kinase